MLLSIIVPVYKISEPDLRRCIDSILVLDSECNNENVEVILVDDGSPDDCGRICEDYARKYSTIKAVHKKNGGLSSARNYGKWLASGDFVCFVDADDWVEPEFYTKIISYMDKTGAEIGIGGMRIDNLRQSKIIGKVSEKRTMNSQEALFSMYTQNGFIWSVCDKVYRRDFLNDIDFDENVLYGEDSLFSYQTLKKADIIAYVPIYGYHYVTRETSMTQNFSKNNFYLVRVYQYIYNDVKNKFPEIRELVLDFYLVVMLNLIHLINVNDAEKWSGEGEKIKKILKTYIYRIFFPSKILTISVRIKLILLWMPRSLYIILWRWVHNLKAIANRIK